jgi:gamma-glutamylcyclotransferase (GGCT)/AIG2-like uncharacterized protein YtfP
MDPGQMARRCPGAQARGACVLRGYRLIFTWDSARWRGGVGSIVPDANDEVWGVLWDITPRHERRLDRYEVVHRDVYRKEKVSVALGPDKVEALVYVATATEPKAPSDRYRAALVRGARAHGLPTDYLARLEATS